MIKSDLWRIGGVLLIAISLSVSACDSSRRTYIAAPDGPDCVPCYPCPKIVDTVYVRSDCWPPGHCKGEPQGEWDGSWDGRWDTVEVYIAPNGDTALLIEWVPVDSLR